MDTIDFEHERGYCSMLDDFYDLQPIGSGTYGIVYIVYPYHCIYQDKCRKKTDPNRIFAMKQVKMQAEKDGVPITTIREIRILSTTRHENIVQLEEVAVGQLGNEFYLIFEYVDHDLSEIIDSQIYKQRSFSVPDIKCIMLQLLHAVEYLHSKWIIHRDLKLSNMLYQDGTGIMKLADFGLAKSYFHLHGEELTPEVVTLWYRAPELLLEASIYGTPVDLWSVGCIFAELVIGFPIFPGRKVTEQLGFISKLLGCPNEQNWPGLSKLPGASLIPSESNSSPETSLATTFKFKLDHHGIDLMNKLIRYDPASRITAAEAMKHPFFSEAPMPTLPPKMPVFKEIGRTGAKSSAH